MPVRAILALLLTAGPVAAAPSWHCLYGPKGSKPVFPLILEDRGATLVPLGADFPAHTSYTVMESNPGALVAVYVEKMYDPLAPARVNDPAYRAGLVPVGAGIAVIRIDRKSGLFQMTSLNTKDTASESNEGHCTRKDG